MVGVLFFFTLGKDSIKEYDKRQDVQEENRYKKNLHLMNEVSKETHSRLNRLSTEGKIGIVNALNGKAVFVKYG